MKPKESPSRGCRERTIPLPEFGERLRHDEGIPGAETRMDLAERAYSVIGRIQRSPGEHQILVTYGGTSTLLIAAWIGMPIDAAGLVQFQVSSGTEILPGWANLRRERWSGCSSATSRPSGT